MWQSTVSWFPSSRLGTGAWHRTAAQHGGQEADKQLKEGAGKEEEPLQLTSKRSASYQGSVISSPPPPPSKHTELQTITQKKMTRKSPWGLSTGFSTSRDRVILRGDMRRPLSFGLKPHLSAAEPSDLTAGQQPHPSTRGGGDALSCLCENSPGCIRDRLRVGDGAVPCWCPLQGETRTLTLPLAGLAQAKAG